MTITTETMIERVDDHLGILWFQMHQAGHRRFQEEIEEVADLSMYPSAGRPGAEEVEKAHDLFERVHAEYTPEIQKRIGHQLVRCPHCEKEE